VPLRATREWGCAGPKLLAKVPHNERLLAAPEYAGARCGALRRLFWMGNGRQPLDARLLSAQRQVSGPAWKLVHAGRRD
jgi:hypothetical protein